MPNAPAVRIVFHSGSFVDLQLLENSDFVTFCTQFRAAGYLCVPGLYVANHDDVQTILLMNDQTTFKQADPAPFPPAPRMN